MNDERNLAAAPLAQQPREDTPRPPDLRTVGPRSNDVVALRGWQPSDLPVIAEASEDPYIPLITTVPSRYTQMKDMPGCVANTTKQLTAEDARWRSLLPRLATW
jgi:hypothetical protein